VIIFSKNRGRRNANITAAENGEFQFELSSTSFKRSLIWKPNERVIRKFYTLIINTRSIQPWIGSVTIERDCKFIVDERTTVAGKVKILVQSTKKPNIVLHFEDDTSFVIEFEFLYEDINLLLEEIRSRYEL
jgi:hypothetical protein